MATLTYRASVDPELGSRGPVVAFCLLSGLLFAAGHRDYPELHTILDTGVFLLSGVLAILAWNMGVHVNHPFLKWVGASFAIASLLEAVHALVVVEWPGALAPIAQAAGTLRPATWPPSAHVLAIGMGGSVWMLHRQRQDAPALIPFLLILGIGILAVFPFVPRYSDPTWLGITRPTLVLVPLLWAAIGIACWHLRRANRVLPATSLMAAVLFLAHVSMLYSTAPHDTHAMVAHLGKLSGYLVMLLALMRMGSSDALERAAAEQKFKSLLESAPDAIAMVDSHGEIALVNSQTEVLFGYSRIEMLGQKIEMLLPLRHRTAHPGHRGAFFSDPRLRPMGAGLELSGQRKDGTEFPVEISLSPLQTQEGTMVMSAIRDITVRKKAELKFRGFLEAAPDAIVIVDHAGGIVLVNSQTENLFGYPRADLLGRKIEVLIPHRYRKSHPAHRDRFFTNASVRPMGMGLELFGLRRDGSEFPIEISLSPLETEEGTLVSSAIRDITERKRFEQQLQEKNVELAKASQAKDRFLASMSHELRTPLNAIIGFTGTLLMKLPGPINADQEKQLNTVQTGARHLLALINDLLDLAKIEAGKAELTLVPTDCAEVIEEVAASLRPQAEAKGLELTVAAPARLLIHSDRRALKQVVINLANNAIKFTERGYVGISLEQRVTNSGSRILAISVEDTGIGIRTEDQAKLFEAYSQVDARSGHGREGTGLGLHLSRKLAEALGGTIEFSSNYGGGSTFSLVLPELP